jgi:hypothetical protein
MGVKSASRVVAILRTGAMQHSALVRAVRSTAIGCPLVDITHLDDVRVLDINPQASRYSLRGYDNDSIGRLILLGLPWERPRMRARFEESETKELKFGEAETRSALQSAILLDHGTPLRNAGAIMPDKNITNTPQGWLRLLKQIGWQIASVSWSYNSDGQSYSPRAQPQDCSYWLTITPGEVVVSPGRRVYLPGTDLDLLIKRTQIVMGEMKFAWLNAVVGVSEQAPKVLSAGQYFFTGMPSSHYNVVVSELLS